MEITQTPESAAVKSGKQLFAALKAEDPLAVIAGLDARQRQVLVTGIAVVKGCRNRSRALPGATIVGDELAPALQALNQRSSEFMDELAAALGVEIAAEPPIDPPAVPSQPMIPPDRA